MPLSVVILAAGQGKRMNSDLPKVLQPLAGRPLLRHVIATVRRLNPDNVFIVYGHGGAEVQEALRDEAVDWVLQAEQLGTGHAVMQALPMIADQDQVLILYGDVPLVSVATLRRLLAASDAGGQAAALALVTAAVDDATGYGRILRDAEGRLAAIVEERDASPDQRSIGEINTGLMAMRAADLRVWLAGVGSDNAQHEHYLTDIVAAAVRQGGPVNTIRVEDAAEILGVNDKLQLAEVEAQYRRARARELMHAGATLADPTRIEVTLGHDVFIDVGVVLSGKVHLGDRVRIGPYCILSESTVGAGTEVRANSLIDGAQVGEECVVGPFARLRPGTVLARAAHIGNFVEVKNSTVGTGSKANHLTYIGDSTVGSGVNVGAGSITCNYDGVNKWETVIGDGAFIGSGTMMVAPVSIGANATIGAGSTITESAPEGKLTLTRAKQTTVENWTRPTKAIEKPKD